MVIYVEIMDRIEDEVRRIYGRMVVNTVWGHIIYKPVEKAEWKIPRGMRTLEEFMTWHREKGVEQERTDHPLALEIYARFTTRKKLSESEFASVVSALAMEILNEWFSDKLIDLMEWGLEEDYTYTAEPLEGEKRVSRDGETWTIKDITNYLRKVLEIEYIE